MKKMHLAAVDLGASSGRVIPFSFDGNRISMEPMTRFTNPMISCMGTPYWDILYLYQQVLGGLQKCAQTTGLASVGIDTWGCDVGVLNPAGKLRGNVICYRDPDNDQAMREFHELLPAKEMYHRTGIANMALNTVYQLQKMKRQKMVYPGDSVLLLPDLLGYFLCGETSCEFAAVSTTQMLLNRMPDEKILSTLNLGQLFPKFVSAGTIKGKCKIKGMEQTYVAAVPGHDTACASVCMDDDNSIFLSSGTWSLLGIKQKTPLIDDKCMEQGYSNYDDGFQNYIIVRDIMGLYLLNICKQKWNRQDPALDFTKLTALAKEAPPFAAWIDPDDEHFFAPDENLDQQIRLRACGKGQLQSIGEIARCIFESLALKYRYAIETVEFATGRRFDTVTIVGGGSQNQLLCQFVANATGKVCRCGFSEATAFGNVVSQLIAMGEIRSLQEGRELIQSTEKMTEYFPCEREAWENAYGIFCSQVMKCH